MSQGIADNFFSTAIMPKPAVFSSLSREFNRLTPCIKHHTAGLTIQGTDRCLLSAAMESALFSVITGSLYSAHHPIQALRHYSCMACHRQCKESSAKWLPLQTPYCIPKPQSRANLACNREKYFSTKEGDECSHLIHAPCSVSILTPHPLRFMEQRTRFHELSKKNGRRRSPFRGHWIDKR